MQPDSDCALLHQSSVGICHFPPTKNSHNLKKKSIWQEMSSQVIFLLSYFKILCTKFKIARFIRIYSNERKWTRVLIWVAVCAEWRSTQLADQLMDHNLAIAACTLLFSTVLLTTIKMRHSQHTRNCTGYKLCVLYSVRHSPQLREYFILLSWTASYSLTFEHVHCFHGPRRWIWFGCNAACSIAALHW